MARRRGTSTSAFGVSRRENHDASAFYARFTLPRVDNDDALNVNGPDVLDRIYEGDSREMAQLADSSVALVVTSPPYFAGKEYEQALGEGDVPASYVEYLQLLEDVFAECKRVLEPGGRIAVNVANLGRKPYRSLSGDVVQILQDRLGLLLRGEIVWVKGQAASGSCAWGSFQSPANPVLRDLTERIVVASKGRFDRAQTSRRRQKHHLPSDISISRDDFMEFTTDLWEFPPESAHRVNHPAPFPVELPQRLIELYTYVGDVVLDPFAGSGSAAVAALRSDRHFVGYDIDAEYATRARERIDKERERLAAEHDLRESRRIRIPARPEDVPEDEDFQARAVREGRRAKEIGRKLLEDCGFIVTDENFRFRNGVEVNFAGTDRKGNRWMFDVSGAFTSSRAGLRRTDTVWKALGKAAVLKASQPASRLVFLTTDLPQPGSAGEDALRAARGGVYHDVIEMLSSDGRRRLEVYALGRNRTRPIPGFP